MSLTYRGLTASEIEDRLNTFGFNEISEVRKSNTVIFLKKFTGLTAYTIEICIFISVLIGKTVEALVMLGLLILNAGISSVQEIRADHAIDSLTRRITLNTRVYREEQWKVVPSRELVPDDMIRIRLGDRVPADAKIVEGYLSIDESPLTGESIPVDRRIDENIFAGSLATRGDAVCRVIATGDRTFFGKTSQLLQFGKKPELIIDTMTMNITRFLLMLDAVFIAALCIRFFLAGNLGDAEILPLILSLLIASVPVALPAMSAVALMLGAMELSGHGVIVRKLNAIEAAAMMDVISLDKTGTITENKLTLVDIISLSDVTTNDVLRHGFLASEETGDPIDAAIIRAAANAGLEIGPDTVKLRSVPFDPRTKLSETVISEHSRVLSVMKGAPQAVAAACGVPVTGNLQKEILRMAGNGHRSLAVAVKEGENARILGLIALEDRPRADSASNIARLKKAGISVKMITGDHLAVAAAIAEGVGLGTHAVSVKDISNFGTPASIGEIESADAIAEVIPEDKYSTVDLLQTTGHHVVGMTGDGVNDAPALSRAEVGIAVSNATDVARATAPVFFTQEGLQNIVDLVISGRSIYRKIIVWVINKIVKTFQIVFFISLATILLQISVITSVQILLILFLFDFVTISISADHVAPSSSPERFRLRRLVLLPLILGLLNVIESFLALGIFLAVDGSAAITTFVFYQILLSGLLNLLSVRESHPFFHSIPGRLLRFLIPADLAVGTFLVTFGVLMPPLPWNMVLFLLIYQVLTVLFLNDSIKVFLEKNRRIT